MRDRTFSELHFHLPQNRRSFVMPGKTAFQSKLGARSAQTTKTVEDAPLVVTSRAKDGARARRIAELKNQIRNGTYRPNLEKVAERLLPELFEER